MDGDVGRDRGASGTQGLEHEGAVEPGEVRTPELPGDEQATQADIAGFAKQGSRYGPGLLEIPGHGRQTVAREGAGDVEQGNLFRTRFKVHATSIPTAPALLAPGGGPHTIPRPRCRPPREEGADLQLIATVSTPFARFRDRSFKDLTEDETAFGYPSPELLDGP